MTNLEKEIKAAIVKADSEYDFEENGFDAEAKAASEVAKRYIAKAFGDCFNYTIGRLNGSITNAPNMADYYNNWLKENGIE